MSIAVDVWQDGERLARSNPLPVQPLSSGRRPFTDDPHSIVHQGRRFLIDSATPSFDTSIANNGVLEVVVTPSDGNWPHVVGEFYLNGAGRFSVYELASGAVTGGTALTAVNMKRDSDTVFGGTAVRNPTINMTGSTWLGSVLILGAAGQGSNRSGSSGRSNDEFIMKAEVPMLFRLTNTSGTAVHGCLRIDVYNSVKINA